jgi:hypothetical protein
MGKAATVEDMLAAVHKRQQAPAGPHSSGLFLASHFLGGIASCLDDPRCDAKYCQIAPRQQWEQAVKEAERQLVLWLDSMRLLGGIKADAGGAKRFGSVKRIKELTPGSILDFEGVITSANKDRDGDILESAGAIVDPKHALLWQHIPFEPVGKHVALIQQNRKRVISHFAMANTLLAQDAAVLVEFDALRLSHGFRPLEVERLDPDEGQEKWQAGFHVKKFEVMETSLVSVTANIDAQILSFSRGKLHHPYAKAVALHYRKQQPHQVTSGWDPSRVRPQVGVSPGKDSQPCPCEDLCPKCRKEVLAAEDAAALPEVPLDEVLSGKPYANEHSCRVADPGQYDKFRRKNKKRKDGKAYGLIFGHNKETDKWEVQSIRFPKSDWSVAEAKKACSDAEGTFEAASSNDDESSTDSTDKTTPIPGNPLVVVPVPAPGYLLAQGRGKSWNGIAIDGSWQWMEDRLEAEAEPYLEQQGVRLDDDDCVHLVGTFADHVIIVVVSEGEDDEDAESHFFSVPWGLTGGEPHLSGKPQEVNLSVTVSDQPLTPSEAAACLLRRKGRQKQAGEGRQKQAGEGRQPLTAEQAALQLIRNLQQDQDPGAGVLMALIEECADFKTRQELRELETAFL